MLTLLINRPFEKKVTEKDLAEIQQDVIKLAKLLKGIENKVYVVGGVGIALKRGHFHRYHHDIDLCASCNDLPEIYTFFQKKGYILIRKKRLIESRYLKHSVTKVSETSPEEIMARNLNKTRLLLTNRKKLQYLGSRLDCLDLFLFEDRDSNLYLRDQRIEIPRSTFFPTQRHTITGNLKLITPNLRKYKPLLRNHRLIQDKDVELLLNE